MKNVWNELFKAHIDEAEAIVNLAREHDMLNSQEFLDWQDKLNAISVL
jgi:hypothetical protein